MEVTDVSFFKRRFLKRKNIIVLSVCNVVFDNVLLVRHFEICWNKKTQLLYILPPSYYYKNWFKATRRIRIATPLTQDFNIHLFESIMLAFREFYIPLCKNPSLFDSKIEDYIFFLKDIKRINEKDFIAKLKKEAEEDFLC